MARSIRPELSVPGVDVKMSDRARQNGSSNQSAQYVDSSAPPQPTPGVLGNIPVWEKKLVKIAEELKDDLVSAGIEPGGLIYLVWGKDGSIRLKAMPTEMKISSMAAILRGLAQNVEQGAAQTMTVGDVVPSVGNQNGIS